MATSTDQPTAAPIYMNEAATSAYLDVPPRTLQRWRSTGEGPLFVRVGPRQVRYRRADVDRWAESRTFAHHAAELSSKAA